MRQVICIQCRQINTVQPALIEKIVQIANHAVNAMVLIPSAFVCLATGMPSAEIIQ